MNKLNIVKNIATIAVASACSYAEADYFLRKKMPHRAPKTKQACYLVACGVNMMATDVLAYKMTDILIDAGSEFVKGVMKA